MFLTKDKYEKYRKELDKYFKKPGKDIEVSEFEGFRLAVSNFETSEGCWNYTRGLVTRISDGAIVADIKRNYSTFWHTWVSHPNGKKYMLCGEDYQGYSIVNLTDGTYKVHFPEEGYKGCGFCWVDAYPSPSGKLLAVDGCIWACPFEIQILDFSDPDTLPYKLVANIDEGFFGGVKSWQDEDNLLITTEVDIRESDGKPYRELKKEEIRAAMDKEDYTTKEETITIPWRKYETNHT
jgi:hypothetical protein